MTSDHEVLGIAPDATPVEIRAAYVARLKAAHPDIGAEGDGAQVSRLVRAYRNMRSAALHRKAVARLELLPRVMDPPVPPASPPVIWGKVLALLILLGAFAAVLYVSGRPDLLDRGARAARIEPPKVGPAGVQREWAAVDEEVLRDAVMAVRSFTVNEGLAGLESHSRRCFSTLASAPNRHLLDYCLAFDAAATNLAPVGTAARTEGRENFFHPSQLSVRHQRALGLIYNDAQAARDRHSEVEAKTLSILLQAMRV
jgi:hypothetical protein